jgi:hypothetical protein
MSTLALGATVHRTKERKSTMASNDQKRDRERLIEVLQRELDAARTREQAALVREQAALEREARLLNLLERLQPKMARTRLPSSPPRQPPGPMRQHIVTLLTAHPKGLPRRQLEIALGTDKNLTDTLQGMVRAGMIVRLAPAFFALAPGHRTPQDA